VISLLPLNGLSKVFRDEQVNFTFEQTGIHPICIANHVEFCRYNAMPLDIKSMISENIIECIQ
jgi:hypothetical protein